MLGAHHFPAHMRVQPLLVHISKPLTSSTEITAQTAHAEAQYRTDCSRTSFNGAENQHFSRPCWKLSHSAVSYRLVHCKVDCVERYPGNRKKDARFVIR